MKNILFRRVNFYIVFIVLVLLLIGISLFKRSENVSVCAYKMPYSIVSEVKDDDYLTVNLLISDDKSFYSDKSCIEKASIYGDGNTINLKINDIKISDNKLNKIKDKLFYNAYYRFLIDFKVDSVFELEISKAYLKIEFNNDKVSEILIGSLSYYKYEDKDNYISLNNIKPITNNNDDRMFYGFQIGIRNLTIYDCLINNLKMLDVNLKDYRLYKSDRIINSYDVNEVILGLDEISDKNIMLKGEDTLYLVVVFELDEYDLNLMVESLGIRMGYLLRGENNEYYMEKFSFYSNNKIMNGSVNVYEYSS